MIAPFIAIIILTTLSISFDFILTGTVLYSQYKTSILPGPTLSVSVHSSLTVKLELRELLNLILKAT